MYRGGFQPFNAVRLVTPGGNFISRGLSMGVYNGLFKQQLMYSSIILFMSRLDQTFPVQS